jgi:Flp pilus assembly protein TadG
MSSARGSRRRTTLALFLRDRKASSAVEFAIVSIPFIYLVLFILQMGIFYMAQSSLDAGVIQTADYIVNTYNSGTTPTLTANSLHAMVYAKSGGMLKNDSNFKVDFQPFVNLTSALVPITDGVFNTGTNASNGASGSVMALRAQGSIPTFVPGLGALATVRSSVLVRRQGN